MTTDGGVSGDTQTSGMPTLLRKIITRVEISGEQWPLHKDVVAQACVSRRWCKITVSIIRSSREIISDDTATDSHQFGVQPAGSSVLASIDLSHNCVVEQCDDTGEEGSITRDSHEGRDALHLIPS